MHHRRVRDGVLYKLNFTFYFLPRDAMIDADYTVARCPSISPSVRLSVRHTPVFGPNV